jgi:hypothetical protein
LLVVHESKGRRDRAGWREERCVDFGRVYWMLVLEQGDASAVIVAPV